MYGWLAAIVLGLTTLGAWALKDKQVKALQKTVLTMEVLAERNTEALSECHAANKANTKARAEAARQAKLATDQAERANIRALEQQREMADYVDRYRQSESVECYKMAGDALPADFVDRVYGTKTKN